MPGRRAAGARCRWKAASRRPTAPTSPARADPKAKMAEIEDRLNKLRSPFRSAETFWIEEIIDPRDTRKILCEFVELAAPGARQRPEPPLDAALALPELRGAPGPRAQLFGGRRAVARSDPRADARSAAHERLERRVQHLTPAVALQTRQRPAGRIERRVAEVVVVGQHVGPAGRAADRGRSSPAATSPGRTACRATRAAAGRAPG